MGKAHTEYSVGCAAGGRSLTVDLDHLFAELAAQSRANGGEGLTMQEVMATTRLSITLARRRIAEAQAAGKCSAGRKRVKDIAGTWRNVPAYVFEG